MSIMSFIKNLYRKHSDTAVFRVAGRLYRRGFFWDNYAAYKRMKSLSQGHVAHDNDSFERKAVKVAFICQYPQGWNKLQCVYEKMARDGRYETVLLAVPGDITKPDKENYNYFKALYGEENVTDAYKDGRWHDLKSEHADYVFIQRPYDNYLPKQYTSGVVSQYAKICYVDYAFILPKTLKDICLDRLFFRNVYLFFAENDMLRDFNIKRFKKSHNKGYRRSVNIGYPVFEYFYGYRKEAERDGSYKILWTPRWTEDRELGGSNLMRYKDKAVKLPEENDGFCLIFRPHPLTFSHMVEVNRMTQEEVDDYLKKFEENDRLRLDMAKDYAETFWDADVLLTDMSSIMVEYFISGKPIVYCETGAVPDRFLEEMLKVLYVVNSWEEAQDRLIKLSNGDDPMREARLKKIEELLGTDFEHISDRFLDEIYRDYKHNA